MRLAKEFGWSLEYIDGLAIKDVGDYMAYEKATMAYQKKEQRKASKKGKGGKKH